MIRSMTAWASAERATAWGTLSCELRSVNHRFLEVALRLPEDLRAAEPALRERISARLNRGKVDAVLRLRSADGAASLSLNQPLVDQLAELAQGLHGKFPHMRVGLTDLLQYPGVVQGGAVDAAGLQADLERADSVILLATAGDEIHGCCHLASEDGAGYFGMFAVNPQLQGSGLGKLLMARAETFVQQRWGHRQMRMTVIDCRHELIAFYQRRGYVRTGITKPFPYGDARFGLPKRDDLRFEILEKTLEPMA